MVKKHVQIKHAPYLEDVLHVRAVGSQTNVASVRVASRCYIAIGAATIAATRVASGDRRSPVPILIFFNCGRRLRRRLEAILSRRRNVTCFSWGRGIAINPNEGPKLLLV
jgi:hypothetical protein